MARSVSSSSNQQHQQRPKRKLNENDIHGFRGGERDDNDDAMTDGEAIDTRVDLVSTKLYTTPHSSAAKQFHVDTSRDFFQAFANWAQNPKSTNTFDEIQEIFWICREHLRLTDMYTARLHDNGADTCATCEMEVKPRVRGAVQHEWATDQHDSHYQRVYPLQVAYMAHDVAGQNEMKRLWDESTAEMSSLVVQFTKMQQVYASQAGARAPDGMAELQKQIDHKQQKNHILLISYMHYAWLVADTLRQEWRAAGRLSGTALKPSDIAQAVMFMPGTSEYFLEQFNCDMIDHGVKSIGSMFCFRHQSLGDWTCLRVPEHYESCGLCYKNRPLSRAELDEQRMQETAARNSQY